MLLGVSLLLGAPARATTCEATITIKGGTALRPVFGFSSTKRDGPIQIYAITTYLGGSVVCQVATPRLEGFSPYRGDWTYGENLPGFEMKSCQPLQAGRDYRVDVMGQCIGSLNFRAGEKSSNPPKTR